MSFSGDEGSPIKPFASPHQPNHPCCHMLHLFLLCKFRIHNPPFKRSAPEPKRGGSVSGNFPSALYSKHPLQISATAYMSPNPPFAFPASCTKLLNPKYPSLTYPGAILSPAQCALSLLQRATVCSTSLSEESELASQGQIPVSARSPLRL